MLFIRTGQNHAKYACLGGYINAFFKATNGQSWVFYKNVVKICDLISLCRLQHLKDRWHFVQSSFDPEGKATVKHALLKVHTANPGLMNVLKNYGTGIALSFY